MSTKPSEQFHESLIAHYKEMIHEAYLECEHEHHTSIDEVGFQQKLTVIMKGAQLDGLNPEDIDNLIEVAKVELSLIKKAA